MAYLPVLKSYSNQPNIYVEGHKLRKGSCNYSIELKSRAKLIQIFQVLFQLESFLHLKALQQNNLAHQYC